MLAAEPEQHRLEQDRPVDLAAAGAEGAIQRQLPGPLRDQHREGVEDQERAGEHADQREDDQPGLEDVDEARRLALLLLRDLRPRPHLVVRQRGRDPVPQRGVADPTGGGDVDVGELAGRVQQHPLRLRQRERDGGLAGQRGPVPGKPEDPDDGVRGGRLQRDHVGGLPEPEPAVRGQPLVDRDLVGRLAAGAPVAAGSADRRPARRCPVAAARPRRPPCRRCRSAARRP